jgi:hypothetical protein
MIEVHPAMDLGDARLIMERHGLADNIWTVNRQFATVLGGLEAELAARDAAIQEYSALLIAERARVAALTAENTRLQATFARIASGSATNATEPTEAALQREIERLRVLVAKQARQANATV